MAALAALGVLLALALSLAPPGAAAYKSRDEQRSQGPFNREEQNYDWILDETPTGEVERLLRENPHNRDMLKNLGSRYYQVIYPVQVRHKTMTGVSTRESGDESYGKVGILMPSTFVALSKTFFHFQFDDGRGVSGSSINQPRVR